MPFIFNKIVDAVVHSVDTINDLDNGLTSSELVSRIGKYIGVRKCKVRALRANLEFMWRRNVKNFREILTERLLCKSFSGSLNFTPSESSSLDSNSLTTQNVVKKRKNLKVSKKSKKKFVRLIKVIKIKTSRIIKHHKVSPDRFHLQLRKKLPVTKRKLTCCLTFSGFKRSKNPSTPSKFWDYAYCRQPKCHCKYKFVGSKKDRRYTLVRVYVRRKCVPTHTLSLNYQLRGGRRQKIKARLRHIMPVRVHADQYRVINEPLAKNDKNYMFTHSLGVHQTARYEELGENDTDKDDTLDIIKRMLVDNCHEHPFIKRFITPFTIYLGCAEQTQFLKDNPGLVFHFDATSSIIAEPYPESKRVYLYSGVVVKAHKILALLHMVSNDQRSITIRDLLTFFRDTWTGAGIEWPPFEAVVVDWSWAGINGILSAWNNTDISHYLVAVYKNLTDGTKINFLTIHLCYGHFMKMISRFLHQHQVGGLKKRGIMEGMAILCHCKCLEDLRLKVTDLATILLSNRKSKTILLAVKNLIGTDSTNKTFEIRDDNLKSASFYGDTFEQFDSEIDPKRPAYESSPFFVDFNELLSDLETSVNCKDLNKDTEENKYRCKPFIVYLNKKLLPYAPLWTGLVIKNPTTEHYSNAIAENSFKIVKESVCENQIHAKAGRVIDKLYDHDLSTVKELTLGPCSQHIKKRKCTTSVEKSGTGQPDDFHCSKNPKIPKTEARTVIHDVDLKVIQSPSLGSADNINKRKPRRINKPGNMNSAEYWQRGRRTGDVRKKYQEASTLKTVVETSRDEFASNSSDNARAVEREIHCHPNGTVANKNYYFAPDVPREYFVGVVPKSPEERDYYRYLRGEDYITLFGKRWISNMVIDYCYSWLTFETACNRNSHRFAYLVCEVSSKFIGRGELAGMCDEFKARCRRDWIRKDRLLFPMNVHDQHFILMYVDVAAKLTYLFDPAMKSGELYHAMCHTNFMKTFGVIFGTECDFEKGICKYPYAADGYNCGIFVIHYIQQILSRDDLKIGPIKPDELRVKLQHECVTKSADVCERCLRCGCGETRREETWVACDCCQKWTHLSCLRHLDKTQEEIQHTSYQYFCDLCSNWMHSA